MKFLEFVVATDKGARRFGLLGETHVYTQEESEFAKGIVESFSTIAMEGSDRATLLNRSVSVVVGGAMEAAARTEGRDREIFTACDWAIELRIPVHPTYDTDSLSAGRKIFLGCLFTVWRVMFPFATRIMKSRKKEPSAQSKKLGEEWAMTMAEGAKRNKIQADKVLELLPECESLLLICGEIHMEGVLAILDGSLSMKKIRESEPTAKKEMA